MQLNELTDDSKMITTKELAEQLGTKPNVITENAKKCLPNKKIVNGKPTYWTQAEVTVLLEHMKSNNANQHNLSKSLIGVSTELTPALKIKKAFELMQEGYEEELQILKLKNEQQQQQLTEQQPKVEVYDELVDREYCKNFRDTAAYLGQKQKEFMNILKGKYIYKAGDEYRAYAEYQQYFTLKAFVRGDIKGNQLLVNMEGLRYFKSLCLCLASMKAAKAELSK